MYTSAPIPLRYLPVNGDPTRVQFPAAIFVSVGQSQSRSERDNREASKANTAPTCPIETSANRFAYVYLRLRQLLDEICAINRELLSRRDAF